MAMKPTDMLHMAAASLQRRKMRTALTVLGVVIGTACIVVMVALGIGSMQQFNQTVAGSATLTEIRVMSSAGRGAAARRIDDGTIASLSQLPGAKTVSPVIEIPAVLQVGKYTAPYATLTAIDPAAVPAFQFDQGGMFTDGEGKPQIVLGYNARMFFLDPTDQGSGKGKPRMDDPENAGPVGPDIEWLQQQARIALGGAGESGQTAKTYRGGFCGLLKQDQSERSYGMYISIGMAKAMIKENLAAASGLGLGMNTYTSALVYANDLDSVLPLLNAVKDMGYEAYSPTEYVESARAEQARQQSQLSMMAVISLLVSAIGIANTMLAGILERRREIGVMKVIGLSILRIRLVFLTEAAMIGMFGGLMGLLVSYILSFFVNASTGEAMVLGMQFQSGVKLIIPWWLAAGAIGVSMAVGMASGIYPAVKATRMSPLEAIRGA